MKKTVKQYLEEIPNEEVRTRAMANLWKEYGHEWSHCMSAALYRAFLWHQSPEGFCYWYEVWDAIIKTEKQNTAT